MPLTESMCYRCSEALLATTRDPTTMTKAVKPLNVWPLLQTCLWNVHAILKLAPHSTVIVWLRVSVSRPCDLAVARWLHTSGSFSSLWRPQWPPHADTGVPWKHGVCEPLLSDGWASSHERFPPRPALRKLLLGLMNGRKKKTVS